MRKAKLYCIGQPLEAPARRAATRSLLRTPIGGARRDRTDDLMLAKHALSQLSYGPVMVGLGGLEPPTSRLSSARSNQLSYKPLSED
jgi:hypothetical protein